MGTRARRDEYCAPPMGRNGAAIVLAGVLVAVGGCGDDDDEVRPSEACSQAFADAAAVSEMQDTHEDLFSAYFACETLDDWIAANDEHPDAIDGVDPTMYASTVCEGNEDEIGESPICAALVALDD
jgi:hypothetical protein